MPDKGIKPPNKRVAQLEEQITNDYLNVLEVSDRKSIDIGKQTKFFISVIAKLEAKIEILEIKLSEKS
jgi:hypothetical protein